MSKERKITPVQAAIERIENADPKYCTPAEVVSILESLLEQERQFMSDIYSAGWKDRDIGKHMMMETDRKKFLSQYTNDKS